MAQQAKQAAQRLGGLFPQGSGKGLGSAAGALITLGALGYGVNASLFNVDGGHRAIKYTRLFGVQNEVYNEGTHFMIPWFETPIIYDVRAKPRNVASLTGTKDLQMVNITCRVLSKPRNVASLTGTKDLQMVNITCRVLSKPRADDLATVYRTLGQDYDERILPSIVNEVLKSVVAQFTASQLITQRDRVSRLVRENLVRRALRFNIILDDVSITHLNFSPVFEAAVEAKQISQQEAQRAAFIVDRARQEKQSVIVRAQGEAKSAELIGEAIENKPGFLELKRIEAAREIAGVISRSGNRVMLDSDTLLLNVNTPKQQAEKASA